MLNVRIVVGRAPELKREGNQKRHMRWNERSKNSRYDATNGMIRMPTICPSILSTVRFMEITLQPEPKLQPRCLALGMMLMPILLVTYLPWWVRLLACILPFSLTGTYRVSTVNGDKFRTQLYFAFIPLKPEKCNLPGVIYVETKYNAEGPGIWTFVLFGPLQFIFGFIFDMLIPALGGAYEIWLITAKGREISAWQGFDQEHFEANVALLAARSGAEVRGRSH